MDGYLNESFSDEEVDFDYEYDAGKYYDFTRPETDFEAREAEQWFETTAYYPPSPIIIKLNWKPSIPVTSGNSSFSSRDVENSNRTCSNVDSEATSAVTGSYSQPRSLTKSHPSKYANFMNPTASQLAKQNQSPQILCDRLLKRSPKLVENEQKSSRSSSTNGTMPTKRQKTEAGYLRKVASLKHQAHFLHKEPKKVGLAYARTTVKQRVTIPKEPNLETAFRAERHRSKNSLESVEAENPNACTFRARPLNRKILEAPTLPLPKKSTPQLPEFQVFHLRTSERAMQHQFINEVKSPNRSPSPEIGTSPTRVMPVDGFKKNLEKLDRFKHSSLNKKESNSRTDKRSINEPPIDSFSKLSLKSDSRSKTKSQSKVPRHSKGLKENAPCSLQLERQTRRNVAKSPRIGSGNHLQCGSDQTIPSVVAQINRSLDIR